MLCGIIHHRRFDLWCVKERYHEGLCTNGRVCWKSTTHTTRMQESLLARALRAQQACIAEADCATPIYVG